MQMQIGASETLLDLMDQIAFKHTVAWTQRGTLGVPDIQDGEISAYKPLVLAGILGRPVGSTHTYQARIVLGVPDTAKEHAALALCRAIVRADDRDAAMMKIVEAMGNRVCDGEHLDPTALAEIIGETYAHLMQEEDLSQKVDYADGLHLITHYFRTMVSSAYEALVLDEWVVSRNSSHMFTPSDTLELGGSRSASFPHPANQRLLVLRLPPLLWSGSQLGVPQNARPHPRRVHLRLPRPPHDCRHLPDVSSNAQLAHTQDHPEEVLGHRAQSAQ